LECVGRRLPGPGVTAGRVVSASEAAPTVRDDRSHKRFVFEQGGARAELFYRAEPDRLFLLHTEVPQRLEGRGIGGQLVRAAVARAVDDGLTVVPWCPFARRWLQRHPDVAERTKVDWTTPRSSTRPRDSDDGGRAG
jgi:uncharacterized protein